MLFHVACEDRLQRSGGGGVGVRVWPVSSPEVQTQGPHFGSLEEGSPLSLTLGSFVALGLLLPHPAPLGLCGHAAPAHPHLLTPS